MPNGCDNNFEFATCEYCGKDGIVRGAVGGFCTLCGGFPGRPPVSQWPLKEVPSAFSDKGTGITPESLASYRSQYLKKFQSMCSANPSDIYVMKTCNVELTKEESEHIEGWAKEKAGWMIDCDGEYPDSDEGRAHIALFQRIAVKMIRAIKNAK